MHADISSEVRKTYDHLHALHSQIEEGVQLFDNLALTEIIGKLREDSNFLARHEHNMEKLREATVPIDSKLKKEIINLIHKILHAPDFSQALGTFQKELFPVLNRIESAIGKWKSKVEAVDNDRL